MIFDTRSYLSCLVQLLSVCTCMTQERITWGSWFPPSDSGTELRSPGVAAMHFYHGIISEVVFPFNRKVIVHSYFNVITEIFGSEAAPFLYFFCVRPIFLSFFSFSLHSFAYLLCWLYCCIFFYCFLVIQSRELKYMLTYQTLHIITLYFLENRNISEYLGSIYLNSNDIIFKSLNSVYF